MQLNRITLPDVEDLKSQLRRQRNIKRRFRLPLSHEDAVTLLTLAYANEVEYRHRKPLFNDNTKKDIDTIAKFLVGDNSKFGLVLCGTCGNGKTTMLYAIQQAFNYLDQHMHYGERRTDEEVGLPIIDARDIVQVRAKDYGRFINIRNKYMLAIDDLGTEPTEVLDYGNALSPLVDLFEFRYTNQMFTVVTTNLTPKQISEKYGARIADRFNEMMQVVVFENPTFRKL